MTDALKTSMLRSMRKRQARQEFPPCTCVPKIVAGRVRLKFTEPMKWQGRRHSRITALIFNTPDEAIECARGLWRTAIKAKKIMKESKP